MVSEMINLEIAFALPERQSLLEIQIEAGKSVEEIILGSEIMTLYPEIDLKVNAVGIWNRSCKLTDIPRDGDRIEIYRPLIADPKDVRRKRAEKAKNEGRADKVTGGRVKSRN